MTVLEVLDYVDNIILLSSKDHDAHKKAEHLIKTANAIGIKVNTKKTQVLRKNTSMNGPVMIDGKHLEDIEEFTYFGTKVTPTSNCDQEVNIGIGKVNQAFAMLKPVWITTNLSVHTKIKIF